MDDETRSCLFSPKSILIYGSSNDPQKVSGKPQKYLMDHGFLGSVYPVNPYRDCVQGLRSFPSADSIGSSPDLAIILVPAQRVASALLDCAHAGVPVAIVCASGFNEIGSKGQAVQAELESVVRSTEIRVVGPNCLGLIVPNHRITASFTTALDELDLLDGNVAFVSQSGAFGSFIFSAAQKTGLGISHFVNTGNELDLTVSEICGDLLEYPEVDVVVGYLEGVNDADRLLRSAIRALELGKPLVLVKVGRTPSGAKAAASHTGAIAGEDRILDGIFRQFGIVRIDGMEPLLDTARMFSAKRRAKGRRTTIVTMSGGAGVLMADVCVEVGLEVSHWEQDWRERMSQIIPSFGSAANPMDLTASVVSDLGLLEEALDLCIAHPNTDVIQVLLGNVAAGEQEIIGTLERKYHQTEKPMVVTWVGGSGRPLADLARRGIPVYSDPTRALRATAALVDYGERASKSVPAMSQTVQVERQSQAKLLLSNAARRSSRQLDEYESKMLLSLYGIATVAEKRASSVEEAVDAAQSLGYPVAVKILSSHVAHKTEVGGLRLNVTDQTSLRVAAYELLELMPTIGARPSLLVQRMAPKGLELVLGVTQDETFGPVVLVGFGGTLVEVFADGVVARPPLCEGDAASLLERLPFQELFDGVRGSAPLDRRAVAGAISSLGNLAIELSELVQEVDVNPLVISEDGALAVDAFVSVAPSTIAGE